MRRSDTCPSCGTRLRWEPPEYDFGFGGCAMWRCPRCKYKRPEGSGMNPYPWRKRQKKRKSWK